MPPISIEDEAARLGALDEYDILDTLPEVEFDALVRLAAEICDVPIALMSLVDADRQWFEAAVGLEETETPRSVAFCAHAILEGDLFTVPDASVDSRFASNPLVTGKLQLRFYAGARLRSTEGAALGTICVLDRVPRTLTMSQQRALRVLGNQVQTQLELRRRVRQMTALERQRDELRSFLVHDLKNALAMIGPNAEFVAESRHLGAEERGALADLGESAARMSRMVRELLESESLDMGRLVLRPSKIDLGAIAHDVERDASRRIESAQRRLTVTTPVNGAFVRADGGLIRRVIENLLDNGLKYGARSVHVQVEKPASGRAQLTISDDGLGIPMGDRERVFQHRNRLDRDAGADGHGIGLAFCRAAVEAHGGRIWVEDRPRPGATLVVELPA